MFVSNKDKEYKIFGEVVEFIGCVENEPERLKFKITAKQYEDINFKVRSGENDNVLSINGVVLRSFIISSMVVKDSEPIHCEVIIMDKARRGIMSKEILLRISDLLEDELMRHCYSVTDTGIEIQGNLNTRCLSFATILSIAFILNEEGPFEEKDDKTMDIQEFASGISKITRKG